MQWVPPIVSLHLQQTLNYTFISFGINSAAEIFQNAHIMLPKVLEGVQNMSDGIIVFFDIIRNHL